MPVPEAHDSIAASATGKTVPARVLRPVVILFP
jgi:hypothetical protein